MKHLSPILYVTFYKKRVYILLLGIFLLSLQKINAQSFAVNTDGSTADNSAILDIKSTTKGMLLPRMTKTEKNAISTPATGLMIYQTGPDSTGFQYYDGSSWQWIDAKYSAGWKTTGNAGTNPLMNFIGTTDNQPLRFRINNIRAGSIDTIGSNTSIGYRTFDSLTTGNFNAAFGYKTMISNKTGGQNTAIGGNSMRLNSTGTGNTALGFQALYSNIAGNANTAIGVSALGNNTADENTAVGYNALFANTSGGFNVAMGRSALAFNTTGGSNTAIGWAVMNNNTTGYQNVAVGLNALFDNTSGNKNTALGFQTLDNNTTAIQNTAVGFQALFSSVTSNNNTAIGNVALYNHRLNGDGYNTAVGASALEQDTAGYWNTAVGVSAFRQSIIGHENTAVGINAGYRQLRELNTLIGSHAGYGSVPATADTGRYNTAVGGYSLYLLSSGDGNAALGVDALHDNSTGDGNTATGYRALYYNSLGSYNTAIGSNTGFSSLGGISNTYIGYSANSPNLLTNANAIGAFSYAGSSNSMVLGSVNGINSATATVNVGIGLTTPVRRLNVAGSGTSGGTFANTNVVAMFENSTNAYLQLSTPNASDAGIYSGNVSTGIRSAVMFLSDSSMTFRTGGSVTRMIIDNTGQVGIATTVPAARLDVDDNFKLGDDGTVLNEIIKGVEVYDIPSLAAGAVDVQTFTITNVKTGSIVSCSPLNALPDGITISYARVSAAGIVEVKFVNAGNATQNPASNAFYFAVIR